MSDLINRSELLEELKSLKIVLNGKQIFSDDAKNTVLRIVNEQPTAYDIDKVVEELEQNKRKLFSFVEDYDEVGDFAMAEIYSDRASEYINAIEIVKQGSVSDDVCECRLLKGYNSIYKTSCGDVFEMENGFKYCPYCGKKIKAVGKYDD